MSTAAIPAWGWVVVLACALGMGAATGPLLRRLPLPAGEEAPADLYARVASPAFSVGVATLSALAGTVALMALPSAPWLLMGTSTIGVLAVAIDARTLFLPLRLCQVGWALGAVGVLASWPTLGVDGLVRAAVGAMAGAALGWLGWRLLGFGFGDARLLMLTVALSAAASPRAAEMALIATGAAGGVLGAAIAALRGWRARFAYGPAILAGLYVGVVWWRLSG